MSYSIKICGITNKEDALMVSEAGADCLGVLVNVPSSPRSLTVEKAKEIFTSSKLPAILLTFDLKSDQVIDLARELTPFGVQLAGNENEKDVTSLKKLLGCEIWKTLHISAEGTSKIEIHNALDKIRTFTEAGADKIVLDSYVKKGTKLQKGGTGQSFDWSLAKEINDMAKTFLFLAGGIKPDKVRDALMQVHPDGIDLSSGVEVSVGKKDERLVRSLIDAVRNVESIE